MLWKYGNMGGLSRKTVYISLEHDCTNQYEPLLTGYAICLLGKAHGTPLLKYVFSDAHL